MSFYFMFCADYFLQFMLHINLKKGSNNLKLFFILIFVRQIILLSLIYTILVDQGPYLMNGKK